EGSICSVTEPRRGSTCSATQSVGKKGGQHPPLWHALTQRKGRWCSGIKGRRWGSACSAISRRVVRVAIISRFVKIGYKHLVMVLVTVFLNHAPTTGRGPLS